MQFTKGLLHATKSATRTIFGGIVISEHASNWHSQFA
jgi:hypothetical protein